MKKALAVRAPRTCYFCDAPATSREHVPPQCLFPESKDLPAGENLRLNLIKVPSCDEHNGGKSDDDAFLFWILTVALQGNEHKRRNFMTKGMRAFKQAPGTFLPLMENMTDVVLQDPSGALHASAAFEVDWRRFEKCMCHIAAGIYYHHTRRRWTGSYRVVTDAFAFLTGPKAQALNATMKEMYAKIIGALAHLPEHGQNPTVFKYKWHSDDQGRHAVQMTFYEGIQVAVAMLGAAPSHGPVQHPGS